jgi:hypothetical protein
MLTIVTGTVIALVALRIRGGKVEPVDVHHEEEGL